jgi:hypothetical protein
MNALASLVAVLAAAAAVNAGSSPDSRLKPNGGWNAFKWDMRRAEVFKILRSPKGDFRTAEMPKCRVANPHWPFSRSCFWSFDDERFLVLGVHPDSLIFSFIDDRLEGITLGLETKNVDVALATFESLVDKLSSKHSAPTSRLPLPQEECNKLLESSRELHGSDPSQVVHLNCDFTEPPSYLIAGAWVSYFGSTGGVCFGRFIGKNETRGFVLAEPDNSAGCELGDGKTKGLLSIRRIVPITKSASVVRRYRGVSRSGKGTAALLGV